LQNGPRGRSEELHNRPKDTTKSPTKMPIPDARRYIVTQSIVDFAGTASWCCTLTNT